MRFSGAMSEADIESILEVFDQGWPKTVENEMSENRLRTGLLGGACSGVSWVEGGCLWLGESLPPNGRVIQRRTASTAEQHLESHNLSSHSRNTSGILGQLLRSLLQNPKPQTSQKLLQKFTPHGITGVGSVYILWRTVVHLDGRFARSNQRVSREMAPFVWNTRTL